MRVVLTVFILLIGQFVSFAQFSDNFSDGDFTNNPAWTGDVTEFTVNVSNQLQSQGPVATAVLHLSTPNALAVNCQWEFWVWLDFNPSSSNYARIYLVSDMEDTEGNLNGYFIQMGKSGTGDAVELWRQDGASTTQILNGIPGRVDYATNVLKIKVARDASGNWDVYSDTTGSGTVYVTEGSVNDNTYTTTSYFGVRCNHTSTRWDKFYFDDFSVIDATQPAVSLAVPVSQNQLDVYFSVNVEQTTAETKSNYSVDNGIGSSTSALRDTVNFSLVHLTFATNFADGLTNTLTVTNVQDLSGNPIGSNNTAMFAFTNILAAEPGDIVINEVLFNTYTGGTDFVEIYNNSDKVIDLKNIRIGELDMAQDSTFNMYAVSSTSYLLYPKKYLCLSYDISLVKKFYNTPDLTALYEMSGFPSYDDDEGGVILTDSAGKWIDHVRYYDDWHLPTLISQDGVSLERLDFNGDSNSPDNWHSASSTAGYATPGYKNSQAIDNNSISEGISIAEPKTFSPDNDGYHDVLVINYKFSQPGQVIKILIFDQMGRQVRILKQNTLLGTEAGTFTWDGMNDKDEKCRMGIYILYAEVTDVNGGKVKKYKEVCVLASKLN